MNKLRVTWVVVVVALLVLGASSQSGQGVPAPVPPTRGPTATPEPSATPGPTPTPGNGDCTMVLGFSVTKDWFLGRYVPFETYVNDAEWELRWKSFAVLSKWTDPEYAGWTEPLVSACVQNAETPTRVIFEIGGYNESAEQIYSQSLAVIDIIHGKYPGATVLFHPIIGGPGNDLCYSLRKGETEPEVVDASLWHPIIDGVIAQLVAEGHLDGATISPEVPTCDWYKDPRGHLTNVEGRDGMAEIMGGYYAGP